MTQILRQNPDNVCQLQQSDDGGVTWTLAFDYALCSNLANADKALDEGINEIYRLLGDYDGTLGSIAPDMVYDSTATDEIRDLALCHATKEIVDIICEMELKRREVSPILTTVGQVGAVMAAILSIPSGGSSVVLFALGASLGAAIVGAGATIFSSFSDALLGNEEVREKVACCMYDSLKGQAPTLNPFLQSLNGCGFAGGSSEAQLRGAISGLLDEPHVYHTFINRLQQGYKYAEMGLVDCPCDSPMTYYFEANLANSECGFISIDTGNYDNYVSGTGYTEHDVNSTTSRIRTQYEFPEDVRITNQEMRFSKTPATGNGLRNLAWLNVNDQDIHEIYVTSGAAFPYPSTKTLSGDRSDVRAIRAFINSSGGQSSILLDRIRITIISDTYPQYLIDDGWNEYTP